MCSAFGIYTSDNFTMIKPVKLDKLFNAAIALYSISQETEFLLDISQNI